MARRSWVALGSVLFLSAAYACSSNETGSSSTTSTSGSAAGGNHSGGAGGTGTGFTDHGAVTSLVITPANQTIDVQSGATASATFTAVATYADNTTGNVDATWSFDQLPIASTNQSGVVTANGSAGGHGTVTATAGGQSATAGVDVMLHITQNIANLSTSDIGLFATPDTVPSGTLLYPYDKTVFAQGLLSPELQWSGGAAGDSYSVHMVGKYVDAQFYVAADPPSRFSVPQDAWTAITQSTNGGDTTLDIERLSGGMAHQAMHESWTIAKGNLRGSIYYWSVNTGQLQKIAPGAASPTVIFDSGAADQLGTPTPAAYDGTTPPWSSGGNNKRCVACHTVSKDGSTIAAVFEKNGSTASPWGTVDLTTAPPAVTQITPYTSSAIYLGLTPDGKYGVENDVNMTMHLADAKTGVGIPSALDGFADPVADPAFSPDGTLFAFSSHVVGSYPVEFTASDLDVMDFSQATTTFSNRRTIAHGNGSEIAFASFSPDSKWAFFQMGDYSRAKYGAAGNITGHNDLYMTDLAGTVGQLSLANASGSTLEARNQHRSYQPTVNPIAVGGYTWVVFVSPRDYGNEMQSTSDSTIENRKQLWVADIDANPQPGVDPSHPAFWLPGQDLTTINMSGYWALEACHQQGTSCDQGFECCTGFCQDDGMGNKTCVPPPGGCSNEGDKCVSASDCCNPGVLSCIGGFCAPSAPPN